MNTGYHFSMNALPNANTEQIDGQEPKNDHPEDESSDSSTNGHADAGGDASARVADPVENAKPRDRK